MWGSTFFIVKNAIASLDTYLLVFYRNFIAAFVMFFVVLFIDKKSLFNKSAIINGSILGIFLGGMYFTQTIGLKYTSSGHSAFIISSAVIMVPILLTLLYNQKINRTVLLSIFIVFIGLFVMTYDADIAINIGDLITVFSAISYAIYIILSGKYVHKSKMLALIAYQFIFCALYSLIAFYVLGGGVYTPLTNNMAISVVYLGLGGTLFCYFITVWVQKYVSSTKMAIMFTLEPVFAVLFAYFFASEQFNLTDFFGASLILCGVVFYNVNREQ